MTIARKPKAIDKQVLDFIAKAKGLRITRSAWIKSVLSQAIDR